LLGLALTLALPSPAAAWHQDGHWAVARIAWKQLEDKHKVQLAKMLKAHPHYDLYLRANCPEGVKEIEWAFVRAAVWPDWVRNPYAPSLTNEQKKAIVKQFNKPVWHYVNLPFIAPGETDKFDAAAIRKTILLPELDDKGEPRHVLAALKQCMKRLRAEGVSDEERGIYLCWLLHLIGDLHQPLHATALIASKATFDPPFDPPHGDLGGNRLAIKVKADDPRAKNLHFYWDALLFSDEPPFPQVEGIVTTWLKDKKYQRDQLPELKATEFLAWAEESLELAKKVVYKGKGGLLKATPLPAKKEKVNLTGLDAPTLPADYQKAAEEVARRRMVLAGYRIADQLRLALKSNP
jgi:hypothetical protein